MPLTIIVDIHVWLNMDDIPIDGPVLVLLRGEGRVAEWLKQSSSGD